MTRVHSRETRIYIGAFDVSGRGVALEPVDARVLPEVSAFGSSGREYLGVGIREDKWTAEVIFDDADDTNGTDAALRDLRTSTARVVTLWPAGDTVARSGRGGGSNIGMVYTVASRVTEVVMGNIEMDFNGPSEEVTSVQTRHRTNITATQNTTSIDNNTLHAGSTTPTTNGGALYYNIFSESDSGSGWIIRLQTSTDDSAWATIASSSALLDSTAGRVGFTTQMERFTRGRFELVGTSGSLQGHISFHRGRAA